MFRAVAFTFGLDSMQGLGGPLAAPVCRAVGLRALGEGHCAVDPGIFAGRGIGNFARRSGRKVMRKLEALMPFLRAHAAIILTGPKGSTVKPDVVMKFKI